MNIKIIILIILLFVWIASALAFAYLTYRQGKKGNSAGAVAYSILFIVNIISVFSMDMVSSYLTNLLDPFLPYPDITITASLPAEGGDKKAGSDPGQTDRGDEHREKTDKEIESSGHAAVFSHSESSEELVQANDISDEYAIQGSLLREDQKDEYTYVASTDGTYRFYSDLSSGGEAFIRVCDKSGETLGCETNALSINLKAGVAYLLSIEYRNAPCDYRVNIGVPIAISDITGKTSVEGNIVYQDQKDQYRYTAPASGTYRFDSNLSAAGEVQVQIYGENGKSIQQDTNGLTIELEAGKTYILSIEYRNGPCDYAVYIGVPMEIHDISGETEIAGNITYQGQKDKYRYTAAVDGIYRFDTNLSAAGEVRVQIYGENGKSIQQDTNGLTMELEAGKTYILSIEYRNGPCDYVVYIGVPMEIYDISGETEISGEIAFQDQRDRYFFTAPVSGTYRFDANLSAGGEVRVRISGENGNSISDGINALSIDLEEGKTYILSVEYRNGPCDYIVDIGIPVPIMDITDDEYASGSITYQDQKDRYYYSASVSGTYYFDTNLSSGGEVCIRISGENGHSLGYGINALTIDLEAGQTYILSVEYRNAPCSYTVYLEWE